MKSLYVSGPMTGIKDKNFTSFHRATRLLRSVGYRVVNPAELDVNTPRQTWEECLRRDIKALMKCGGIATLPGWRKSRGARLEIYIAKALGWPVHSVRFYT